MSKISLLTLIIFFTSGCSSFKKDRSSHVDKMTYMEAATVWMQSASEVKALSFQAYNAAILSLENQLRERINKKKKPAAIVLDVDETVLDNSPYQATAVLENQPYRPETWDAWVQKADAELIPGVYEFLKFAESKGIEIFLITNRDIKHFEATYKNLIEKKIPIKKSNLFLKTDTNSKTARRNKVLKNYDILVYAGDVLTDFSGDFEHKTPSERDELVFKDRKKFGIHYIVLPNTMYGEWEGALYNYNYGAGTEEKSRMRRRFLRPIK